MQCLQIRKHGEFLGTPKVLEIGEDFDLIFQTTKNVVLVKSDNLVISPELDEIYSSSEFTYAGLIICQLSDCFESRPLMKIDGYQEFDLIEVRINVSETAYWNFIMPFTADSDSTQILQMYRDNPAYVNHGCIFKPENIQKLMADEKTEDMFHRAMEICKGKQLENLNN